MTLLAFGSERFDADLVVFDKDGTLTDFEHQWGQLTGTWLESLSGEAGGEAAVRDMGELLGYDLAGRRSLPDSPLAVAPDEHLQIIVAAVLFRYGVPWAAARERATETYRDVVASEPLTGLIRPLGDVSGLLRRLHQSSVGLAVVTTDNRSRTEAVLPILGIDRLVDDVVCGDDGLDWKPAPDMLLAVCRRLCVEPARVAVVGDSVADMLMARQAGGGLCVGVLTGTGDRMQLAAHADVLLESIDEIAVVG
ncbi:MAG TPA: HAD family hydrolase [Anaerolineae bacterium]|nr:HAD family hydrolase [Anaerolineae bacterium]